MTTGSKATNADPHELHTSKFRMVSFGYAAENKKLGSKQLEVTPVELTQFVDGELVSDKDRVEHRGVDADGNKYTVAVHLANSIVATWMPIGGSNRLTAPDVRRGEEIILYQFADSDEYFWESAHDGHLRRLETIIYAISATRNEDTKVLTPDNTYSITWSTHSKELTIQTCKADGEPYAYTVQLNTKDGTFCVTDDIENFFQLDSAEHQWTMQNASGSKVSVWKDSIFAECSNLYQVKCKHYELIATEDIKTTTKAQTENMDTLTVNATTSIDETTPVMHVTASTSVTFTTPNVNMTQNLNVMMLATVGGLAAGGGAMSVPVGGGSLTINVPTQVNGNLTTVGLLTNNGVNVGSTHQHNETGTGGGITTPPI